DAASTAHVPIDVLPLRYKFEQEVMVDRVVAPSTARMGQSIVLRVLVSSIKPAKGRLSLLINGDPVQIGPTEKEMDMPVSLNPGANIIPIPLTLPFAGPQKFEAHFTPDRPEDDSIAQNNSNMAITFVQSEGRVLLIAPTPDEVRPLAKVLTDARLDVRVVRADEAPKDLVDWGAYDAVIIANTSAADVSQKQQEDIRAYVHDLGGGLVMVGGPDSFGAGGWIGSPVADALPIKLDPPQQRKMPRGALVLLMHSCEMPRGNYWGQQVCLAAVNNLSRLDLAGVLEFSFAKGDWWVHPLSEVGNKAAITRAINSLTFGDMPSFDRLIQMAHDDLVKVAAGAKHIIIISDGDPQIVNWGLLDDCRDAKISISTVLVYPHSRAAGGFDWQTMRKIAQRTRGRFYSIIDEGDFAKLPAIFIKEAQVVKRSLIWEGDPFSPTIVNSVSEPMRGLTTEGLPPISGYIVAAEREGLSVVTLRGKENDPILAHWQYGLGKAVAFTSDSGTKWTTAWPSWGKYRAFWEQHVRWAMRPGGNADMRISTEQDGDKTRVIVEALDAKGEHLNFVRFQGRIAGPNGSSEKVELRQVGPGRYEGIVDSGSAGAYVMNFRYLAPGADGKTHEGNIQAAITRPYADEFKTLQDNAPLGKLVAELTGGRVVDDDPTKADLWLRKDLKMPIDQRPIWLVVALISLGAFLFDVAVRRVRIDPKMIAESVRKGLGAGASEAGKQMGGLKEARQRAQQAIGRPGAPAAAAVKPGPVDASTAKAKFEVSEEELKKSRTNEAVADLSAPDKGDRPGGLGLSQQTGEAPTQEQGLSRLKKARERAQEKFEDEEPKGS
ncbi:MAG TPA: glutamine amidotransferase, partial [Phycisphaerales bacterium]|nr:glutamine amidotransferase [Phycisphaerales bacterium]